jgi:hypothetical protein
MVTRISAPCNAVEAEGEGMLGNAANWTRYVLSASTIAGCIVGLEIQLTTHVVVILLSCLSINLLVALSAIVVKKKTDAGLALASIFLVISLSDWRRYGVTYLALVPAIASILCVVVVLIESFRREKAVSAGAGERSEFPHQ